MPTTIDEVKEKNPIEQVIGEMYPLMGTGRYHKAQAHDSLVVDVRGQAYFWNSNSEQGDVIEWVKHRENCDFKDAVEWLCRRTGLAMMEWSSNDAQVRLAARAKEDAYDVAMRVFLPRLWQDVNAIAYARGRGWRDEALEKARLGYTGNGTSEERKALIDELSRAGLTVDAPAVKAVLMMPAGMLVYPHVRGGRVRYLSCRSIAEKRHWNLPAEYVGERQVYCNACYSPSEPSVLLVEGQADALTLAQWEIPAVALAGKAADAELLGELRERHKRLYVALDNTDEARPNALKLADAIGPMTRLVWWPVKDANEWLTSSDPKAEEIGVLLEDAETWVEYKCRTTGQVRGAEYGEKMREAFALIARMEDFDRQAQRKTLCAHLHIDQRVFQNLLKVALREAGKDESTEEIALVETVGGFIGEHLIELLYDPASNETKFGVRYPDGHTGEAHALTIGDTRYIPMPPSTLMQRNVICLPSGLGPEKTVKELHAMVRDYVHRYLDVEEFYENMAVYYVLLTWLYDAFENLPYLRALGDWGTGKTRFLQVIGICCYRPAFTSGATTTSPIFRILDMYHPTLVLDEADFDKSDASADIMKILNTGYMKGMAVLRAGSEKNNFQPEAFDVFGPKLLATRKPFVDRATESRCLTREMGGSTTRRLPMQLPIGWREEACQIRNALLTYRFRFWRGPIAIDESLAVPGVEPRLNQVVLPLLMIVDEDSRKGIYQFVKRYAEQMIVERSMSIAAKVLQAIVELRESNSDEPLLLTAIAKRVNAIIDAENEAGHGEDGATDDDQRKKDAREVKPKKIGYVARGDLQLQTEKLRGGPKKGSYVVIWDEQKIDSLKYRYGLKTLDGFGEGGTTAPSGNGDGHPVAATVEKTITGHQARLIEPAPLTFPDADERPPDPENYEPD